MESGTVAAIATTEGAHFSYISCSVSSSAVSYTHLLDTVETLREAGAEVLGVAALFTYGMAKGSENLAGHGVRAVCLKMCIRDRASGSPVWWPA